MQLNQPLAAASNSAVAPHQAETLREVAQETAQEELRSPRISWANGGAETGDIHQYAEDLAAGVTNSLSGQPRNGHPNGSGDDKMAARAQQDDLAVAQNGGLISQDNTDDADMDGEESDLDDDMMDKISSSPSIDDGGSFRQIPSFECMRQNASPASSPASPCFSEARSSSPYLDPPVHLPLQHTTHQQTSKVVVEGPICHHHLPGAFPEDLENHSGDERMEQDADTTMGHGKQIRGGTWEHLCSEPDRWADKKPRMTRVQNEEFGPWQHSKMSHFTDIHATIGDTEDDRDEEDGLIFPYEGSTDEDDDDLSLQSTSPDSRFIDSGWGGECLQDTEDIDFELVYALHTFIATVEGQANATKGDAMVLLDDSNSYWWLVRVVKDSSIGKKILTRVNFELNSL